MSGLSALVLDVCKNIDIYIIDLLFYSLIKQREEIIISAFNMKIDFDIKYKKKIDTFFRN